MPGFSISSELAADPEQLGEELLTLAGVNRELGPFIRMTAPARWRELPIYRWPTQAPLFSSWILLFGLLPVDRHHFYLDSIQLDRFSESSSSWFNRLWHHRRTITAGERGATVTDALHYEGRVPLLDRLTLPIYRAVFTHRHRRLRGLYAAD